MEGQIFLSSNLILGIKNQSDTYKKKCDSRRTPPIFIFYILLV